MLKDNHQRRLNQRTVSLLLQSNAPRLNTQRSQRPKLRHSRNNASLNRSQHITLNLHNTILSRHRRNLLTRRSLLRVQAISHSHRIQVQRLRTLSINRNLILRLSNMLLTIIQHRRISPMTRTPNLPTVRTSHRRIRRLTNNRRPSRIKATKQNSQHIQSIITRFVHHNRRTITRTQILLLMTSLLRNVNRRNLHLAIIQLNLSRLIRSLNHVRMLTHHSRLLTLLRSPTQATRRLSMRQYQVLQQRQSRVNQVTVPMTRRTLSRTPHIILIKAIMITHIPNLLRTHQRLMSIISLISHRTLINIVRRLIIRIHVNVTHITRCLLSPHVTPTQPIIQNRRRLHFLTRRVRNLISMLQPIRDIASQHTTRNVSIIRTILSILNRP